MSGKEMLTQIEGIIIYRNFVENLPYNPLLKALTKEKRKLGILSEVLFWKQVRNRTFTTLILTDKGLLATILSIFM